MSGAAPDVRQVRYLLDTNICIYIAKHKPLSVRQRFESLAAQALAMSVVTLGELQFGAEKSQSPDAARGAIAQLLSVLAVHELPAAAATHYGQIRAALQRSGQIIGGNDLWLAAHARAMNWTLVTNNEREFVRVPGLQVENWVAEH